MSGFEVAGLVLGAFPLAITALEKYREVATRLGLFRHIRLQYKKCRDDLEFHRLVFKRNLRHLLLPLVVDDDRIEALLADPGGDSWKEPLVADLLEKRLQDSFELYIEYIEGMDCVMKEIHKELAFDSQSVQTKVNTPKIPTNAAGLKSALGREGRAFQIYRLKFSNGETNRKRLFAELQSYNDKLEKLLDSSDKDMLLVQQRTTATQCAAIDAAICSFWIQARDVFKALASAWNCRCQQHGAKLLLQHRTSKKPEFQVTFTNFTSSQWEIQKTKIAEGNDIVSATMHQSTTLLEHIPLRPHPAHRHHHKTPLKSALRTKGNITTSTTTSTTTVSLLKPLPSITFTSVETTLVHSINQPISNLCTALEQSEGSCCGYLSDDNCRYYVYTVSRESVQVIPSVTLDQILDGRVISQPTRTQRYNVSLILASSFLQLLESPWMTTPFRKTDILFLGDLTKSGVFVLDQPHINRDFSTGPEGTTSESAKRGDNVTDSLDHLGILLLELCFGNVLEKQACRKSWPAGGDAREKAVFDVMAARNWQCQVNEEAGPDYAEAVGWCLGGNRSSQPERWRHDMLQKVIQPLQRCRDYLAGSLAQTAS
ncbi:hypothetical protein BGZ61DRAFT_58203 [Ilyonectria robusta]|uniref:uncharacterized protein n=1 Tax=Ilyonectria robusta TaxID=1079257 RepID=UPI001E8D9770|nr:uncharacterized protein BGZ61DRAFT_58203 [Ilyonectria robusta]KAH8685345.1 hypothetical protein BGZ61DRAFT_58203 [Ilyonectria robusta]